MRRRLCTAAAAAFPAQPAELSAAWLTSVLRSAGRIPPSASVSAFTTTPLGASVGLASTLCRVAATVTQPDAPPVRLAAVAKFTPTDPEARAFVQHMGMFARECGFYTALRGRAAAVTAPACWFAHHDAATGAACLLLEDLDAGGWQAGDQVAGASVEQAQAVLEGAAKQHAAFWAHPLLPDWATWLPALDGAHFAAGDPSAAVFGAAWPRWRRRYPAALALLPPHLPAALDAAPGAFGGAAARLLRQLGRSPGTLLHGDLRLDNVVWRRDCGRLATRQLDMGDCASGRAAFDVAYFLSMSLEPSLRRAHQDALLAHYAAALRGAGVSDYPAAQLQADYRAASAYSLCLAVGLGGGETEPEAMAPRRAALAAAVATRAATALADLGPGALPGLA